MKKYQIFFMLFVIAATQGFLYLGKCIGRDESQNKIETLEHKVDSLHIENAQMKNDAMLWKYKYDKLELITEKKYDE